MGSLKTLKLPLLIGPWWPGDRLAAGRLGSYATVEGQRDYLHHPNAGAPHLPIHAL